MKIYWRKKYKSFNNNKMAGKETILLKKMPFLVINF